MTKQAFKTVSFKKSSKLFKEGEKADCAYIIQKGSVRISKRGPSGRSITIATAAKGGIVGEMAIISECPRSATVTAIESVEAIAISKRSFDTRLEAVDPFLHSLITTVIMRLRKTSDHTVALYEKVKASDLATAPKSVSGKPKPINKKGFEQVNFMLADPNQQTRNSLRSGLFGFGLREIMDIHNFEQISESLSKQYFDLIMLDTAFGSRKVLELIRDIRHGINNKNPFISIVLMTENNDKDVHKQMRYAGCDEVLLKPLSLNNVTIMIEGLCQSQRTFVVTRDYAGPDRADFKEKNAQDAPRFDAPNTLAAKVVQGIKSDNIEQGIIKCITNFNELIMERHLVQLEWLLNRLNPETDEPFDMQFLLDKVDSLLQDLSNRADNSRFQASTPICHEMRDLVLSLKENNNPNTEQWNAMNDFYRGLIENMPLMDNNPSINHSKLQAGT